MYNEYEKFLFDLFDNFYVLLIDVNLTIEQTMLIHYDVYIYLHYQDHCLQSKINKYSSFILEKKNKFTIVVNNVVDGVDDDEPDVISIVRCG